MPRGIPGSGKAKVAGKRRRRRRRRSAGATLNVEQSVASQGAGVISAFQTLLEKSRILDQILEIAAAAQSAGIPVRIAVPSTQTTQVRRRRRRRRRRGGRRAADGNGSTTQVGYQNGHTNGHDASRSARASVPKRRAARKVARRGKRLKSRRPAVVVKTRTRKMPVGPLAEVPIDD